MAMSTYLKMIHEDELEDFIDDPEMILELEESDDDDSYSTHFFCSLNYFVTGNAWPGQGEMPLAAMLAGPEEISCEHLENGAFFILRADDIVELVDAMGQLDFDAIEEAIENADLESLVDDEEMEDGELLLEEESPSGTLRRELEGLLEFYQRAAEEHMAVLSYTT